MMPGRGGPEDYERRFEAIRRPEPPGDKFAFRRGAPGGGAGGGRDDEMDSDPRMRLRTGSNRWQHDRADDYVLSSSDDRFGGRNTKGGWNNGGGGGGLGRGGMRDFGDPRNRGHMEMGGPGDGRGGPGDRRGGSRFHRREEAAPEWFGETIEQGSVISVSQVSHFLVGLASSQDQMI